MSHSKSGNEKYFYLVKPLETLFALCNYNINIFFFFRSSFLYIFILNHARASYNVKNSLMVCDVSCLGVMVLWGVSVLQIVIYYNCKAHTKLISNDNNSSYYIPLEIVAF